MIYEATKAELYRLYEEEVNNEQDFQELISELNKIHELKKKEKQTEFTRPEEFYLKSNSWQVAENNANGHYTYIRDIINDEDKDSCYHKYLYKNENTGKVFSIDNETLKYLTTHKDNQDYKFVYVGMYVAKGEREVYKNIGI